MIGIHGRSTAMTAEEMLRICDQYAKPELVNGSMFALSEIAAAIAAAEARGMEEAAKIADGFSYDRNGFSGKPIADAIRARIQPAPSSEPKE